MANILVADDEASIRQVVRLACERAGHVVHEAINAPTAIQAYERWKPDLLILDVGMPGGGGPFVLQSLRFGGRRALCPVLIISGTLDRSPDETKTLLAVDRVLAKPFRMADLLSASTELLAKARLGTLAAEAASDASRLPASRVEPDGATPPSASSAAPSAPSPATPPPAPPPSPSGGASAAGAGEPGEAGPSTDVGP